MWIQHVRHLLFRALKNTLTLGGSTLAGVIVVGIGGIIFGFGVTLFFEWMRGGRTKAVLLTAIKSWPTYLGTVVGLFLAWVGLYVWTIGATIYGDHEDLVRAVEYANSQMIEWKQKCVEQNKNQVVPPTKAPQISAETFPERIAPGTTASLGNDKPGMHVLITAHTAYRNPVIEMNCSVPCTFFPALSFFHGKYMTSTMTEQLASPPGAPNTIRIRLVMPVKFEADEQLSLEFRSKDSRELAITGVHPYFDTDAVPK